MQHLLYRVPAQRLFKHTVGGDCKVFYWKKFDFPFHEFRNTDSADKRKRNVEPNK